MDDSDEKPLLLLPLEYQPQALPIPPLALRIEAGEVVLHKDTAGVQIPDVAAGVSRPDQPVVRHLRRLQEVAAVNELSVIAGEAPLDGLAAPVRYAPGISLGIGPQTD